MPEVRRTGTNQGPGGQRSGARRSVDVPAYEERRAASRGAIAVDVVDRVTYVEHEVNDCLAAVLNSPLACRRVIYRLRQMLRDHELHREGWRDVITPAWSLGEAINCRPAERADAWPAPHIPRPAQSLGAHLQPRRVGCRDPRPARD